jgi:hypothetical protein
MDQMCMIVNCICFRFLIFDTDNHIYREFDYGAMCSSDGLCATDYGAMCSTDGQCATDHFYVFKFQIVDSIS